MREKLKVIIIGAGGHGKVVADALIKQNEHELVGFVDDNKKVGEMVYQNHSVVGRTNQEVWTDANAFVVAIGNNKIRKEIFEKMKTKLIPVRIIHPSAILAFDTLIGEGSVVLAGAVINPEVVVEDNCIINSLCLIDHEVKIRAHAHVGQGAIIGSGNSIQELEHVFQGQNRESKLH